MFRLHQKSDIDAIFKKGGYRGLGLISVKFLATEQGNSRFMISVKKRVGSAPCRNHVKRLLREAIRLNRFALKQNYDMCFMVTRPPQHQVSFAYIEHQVRKCFRILNDSHSTACSDSH